MREAVWLTSKRASTRPRRPFLLGSILTFPAAGRGIVAAVLALPDGRLRRAVIEWAMREGAIGTFNRREFEEARPFASADLEARPCDEVASVLGIGEVLRGYDEFQRFLRDWVEIWGEFWIEPRHVVDLGSSVLLLNHMRGHGPASGIRIDGQEEAQLYVFARGRCVRYEQWWSWDEALNAVGLSELPPVAETGR